MLGGGHHPTEGATHLRLQTQTGTFWVRPRPVARPAGITACRLRCPTARTSPSSEQAALQGREEGWAPREEEGSQPRWDPSSEVGFR